ncbi:putative membrane protein [Desulfovibrio sp. A2]|nr:putative membrane protein [Desulfovibrio sp. A2]
MPTFKDLLTAAVVPALTGMGVACAIIAALAVAAHVGTILIDGGL